MELQQRRRLPCRGQLQSVGTGRRGATGLAQQRLIVLCTKVGGVICDGKLGYGLAGQTHAGVGVSSGGGVVWAPGEERRVRATALRLPTGALGRCGLEAWASLWSFPQQPCIFMTTVLVTTCRNGLNWGGSGHWTWCRGVVLVRR